MRSERRRSACVRVHRVDGDGNEVPTEVWQRVVGSTREQHTGGQSRPSWCYGTPGIARAQQLAGLALTDPHRQQSAEQALAACAADERQLAQLRDASLCHGWAGLAHTIRRAATDATSPGLTAALHQVRARLVDHLDRRGPPDHDGLLEGTTGIHLVLDHHPDPPSTPPWDACLLLTG